MNKIPPGGGGGSIASSRPSNVENDLQKTNYQEKLPTMQKITIFYANHIVNLSRSAVTVVGQLTRGFHR